MRILCALIAAAAALPAAAGGFTDIGGNAVDEYGFAIRGRVWMTDQEYDVQDADDDQPGTVIELDRELDFDGDPVIPELDLEYRHEELALHITAWTSGEGNREEMEQDEGFDGRIILAGDRVAARVLVVQAAAHFEWVFLDLGSSKKIGLELGAIIGARWTRFETNLRVSATAEHLHSGTQAVLPDLGLTLNVGLFNFLELEAWASGMWIDAWSMDYESINGGAELRIFIDDHFYIGGGYRFSSGSLEWGDADDADDGGRLHEYEYHGPMITVGMQF